MSEIGRVGEIALAPEQQPADLRASAWLDDNFDRIGKESTVDINTTYL